MPTTSPKPAPRQAAGGSTLVAFARQTWAGLRVLLGLTVLLGLAYPLLVWGVAQLAIPWQANGSFVKADGAKTTNVSEAVGSALIAQPFTDPQYFWPRPSAGEYDTLASGGSNLGPSSEDLVAEINQRRADLAAANGVDPKSVPADAVTASFSGLDPDISPANAAMQVERVAKARGISPDQVRELVAQHTAGRDLGVIGNPRVNVLLLNIDLDKLQR